MQPKNFLQVVRINKEQLGVCRINGTSVEYGFWNRSTSGSYDIYYATVELSMKQAIYLEFQRRRPSFTFHKCDALLINAYQGNLSKRPAMMKDGSKPSMDLKDCGISVGCPDGTIIRIKRPEDVEGWYYRKLFPATNMQAVVDHRGRLMSYCLRPGSCNDQSVWNRSNFSRTFMTSILTGYHILADGGYSIRPWLITPYSDTTEVRPQGERKDSEAHLNS